MGDASNIFISAKTTLQCRFCRNNNEAINYLQAAHPHLLSEIAEALIVLRLGDCPARQKAV